MKIQCDVCNQAEASVFCCADEAALCQTCDHRIHHANKLAEKHKRFSLLHPTYKEAPLCDICQERRAFLFCHEDRAILCRECDFPIHKATEHTQKHNRFLLTGVKLSASSSLFSTSSSGCAVSSASQVKASKSSARKPVQAFNTSSMEKKVALENYRAHSHSHNNHNHQTSDASSVSTSSISEYLETLPGWHVEDFFDPSPNPFGYCKTMDDENGIKLTSTLQNMGVWVPQYAPATPLFDQIENSLLNGHKVHEETDLRRDNGKRNTTFSQFNPLKKSRQALIES